MSALPTPEKKLLALRKRLCDEGLDRAGMEAVINTILPGQIASLTGWSDVKTITLDNVLSQPCTPEAACNTDAVIYDFTTTCVCSAIFFNEATSPSTIQNQAEDAQYHLATTKLIEKVVQQRGFTFEDRGWTPETSKTSKSMRPVLGTR